MTGKQLKNSILQWAIQGKLVPQDPTDEPASVLLEKIRQEKERLIKEKKIKRDKNASIIYRGEDNSYYEKLLATGEVRCIDEEIPFEIPQGWEWCRLNSYSDVRDGTHDTPQYVACGYPLITSKDFIGGIFDFSKTKYIDEQTFIEINKRSNVQIGDILFSMIGGNIGSMILITKENYFDMAIKNVALFKQYIYNNILIKYLYFYLQSQVVNIKNTASGGAQSFVSLNILRNYLMPIPPLNEQKKIIETFRSLDFVIQQYEKTYCELENLEHELFPKLKKSILQEAIQGKLVPQIAEEGTAQELLEQIKTEKQKLVKEGKLKKSALNTSVIFRGDDNKYYEQVGKKCLDITEEIPFEIPDSWSWCHLNDIAESDLGKTMNKGQNAGKLVPYLCSINVYWNKIDLSKIKRAQFTESELAKYLLQKNDLLICEGGDIGRAAIWDKGEIMYYQNALHRVRFYGKVFPKFFLYILSLYKALGLLDKKSKGMTIKHFTKSALNSIVIPLPPLLEQKRITEKIDQLMQLLR